MKNIYTRIGIIFANVLALSIVLLLVVSAEVYTGSGGLSTTYKLDTETGLLEIMGSGPMGDFEDAAYDYSTAPWGTASKRGYVKNVIIYQGVTSIGNHAFQNLDNLISVTIPASVTEIYDTAFSYCDGLVSMEVDESNENYCDIDGVLFLKNNKSSDDLTLKLYPACKANEAYNIPDGVTDIGVGAFSGNDNLFIVTIPDSVTNIGNTAFSGCINLANIIMGDGVTHIGIEAFSNTNYYNDSSNWEKGNVLYIGKYLIKAKTSISDSYFVKADTRAIAGRAFYECSSLETVFVPATLKSIGQQAFLYCGNLKSLYIPSLESWLNVDLYDSSSSPLNSGNGALWISLVLADEINIPDSIASIDTGALIGCTNITSIAISDNVKQIGDYAFFGCTGLTSVSIGKGVSRIGSYAFGSCTALETIDFNTKRSIFSSVAFTGCTALREIYLYRNSTADSFFSDSYTKIYKEYTVYYDADGGSGAPSAQRSDNDEDLTISEVVPTKTGYTFVGWQATTSGGTYEYSPGDIYSQRKTVTLYAEWQVITYTITYDANGGDGAPASQTKSYGKAISLSSVLPSRTGYKFVEWSDSNGNSYVAGAVYSENSDLVLKAIWEAEVYTITYYANGGTNAPQDQSKTYGVVLILSSDLPTRPGYTFQGWSTNSYGDVEYSPGEKFYIEADTTLYAVWKAYTYVITYDANGGTGAPSSQIKSYDKPVTLSKIIPQKEGYNFVKWQGSNGGIYAAGGVYSGNSDLVLTAVWEIKTYAITYNANGGSGAPEGQTKTHGIGLLLSNDVPVRTNYDFRGWSNTRSGSVVYAPGDTYTEDASVTLYAVWKAHTITGKCGDNLTYTLDLGSGIMTIDGSGEMYSWSSYTSVPWYSYRSYIKVIIIEEGALDIGQFAFYNCKNLTNVTIPTGLLRIGSSAFYQCTGLNELHVPNIECWLKINLSNASSSPLYMGGVSLYVDGMIVTDIVVPNTSDITGIGQYKFYNYDKLTSIVFPNGITHIAGYAFFGCENLREIAIPVSVAKIGWHAFQFCYNLESFTVSDDSGLTTIGEYAFDSCSNLKSIYIPSSVTTIGDCILYGCYNLEEITIPFTGNKSNTYFGWIFGASYNGNYSSCAPKSIKAVTLTGGDCIASGAFLDCNNIEKINISDSVTSIGTYAFQGCSGLTNITIPESVTSIGSQAFAGCNGLTSVKFLTKNAVIDEYSFEDTSTTQIKTVYLFSNSTADAYFADDVYEKIYMDGQYLVSYNATGGSDAPLPVLYPYGTEVVLSDKVPTWDGYVFKGWSIIRGGDVVYLPGTSFTIERDVTLYAVWRAQEYTVVYDANGGEQAPQSDIKTHNVSMWLSSLKPVRAGYTFNGWSTKTNGTVEYTPGARFGVNADTTLYAVWTANKYSVTYDANEGENAPRSQSKTHDVPLILSVEIPTREGYVFKFWAGPDGETYFAGDTYFQNAALTLTAVWEIKTYSIIYDVNGGIGCPENSIKEHFAGYTIESIIPTREGYNFKCWLGLDEKIYYAGDIYSANSDLTLTAVWEIKTYTITYDADGGSGVPENGQKEHFANYVISSVAPEKVGYNFIGWLGSDGKTYVAKYVYSDNADLVLTAVWEIKTYTISYDANGGSRVPESGQKEHFTNYAISLIIPVKEGHTFRYWMGSDGRIYYPGDVYTQDQSLSLTAVWAPHSYTISYDLNGGIETFINEMKYFDIDFVICSYTPTKNGYNFIHWLGSDGESYVPGSVYATNADLTLTAVWDPKYVVITYDPNGGTVSETSKNVQYNTAIGETAIPVREGYTFTGWGVEKDGGEQITSGTVVSSFVDFTVYAHWVPNKYAVSFDAVGGIVATSDKVVTFDSVYGSLPVPVNTGHTFEGWYTAKNGGKLVTADTVVTTSSDHILYARWMANVYRVYFDANGGECDKDAQNITFGSAYGELPVPERNGYTFVCWSSSKDDVDVVTSITNHTVAGDVTLYAIWSANTYKLTFDALGGELDVTDKTVTFDLSYGTLPTSVRPNYIFGGWFFEKEYKNKLTSDMIVSIAGDQTVYAMWIPAVFNVVYDANGGEGAPDAQTKLLDVDLKLSDVEPTRKGFRFKGWSTSADGAVAYAPGDAYSENANLTLYAVWEAINYGDPTGDGDINAVDAVLLAQKLAGWDVNCDELAADCNGDDIINAVDAVLLAQYLAGWDVSLG